LKRKNYGGVPRDFVSPPSALLYIGTGGVKKKVSFVYIYIGTGSQGVKSEVLKKKSLLILFALPTAPLYRTKLCTCLAFPTSTPSPLTPSPLAPLKGGKKDGVRGEVPIYKEDKTYPLFTPPTGGSGETESLGTKLTPFLPPLPPRPP